MVVNNSNGFDEQVYLNGLELDNQINYFSLKSNYNRLIKEGKIIEVTTFVDFLCSLKLDNIKREAFLSEYNSISAKLIEKVINTIEDFESTKKNEKDICVNKEKNERFKLFEEIYNEFNNESLDLNSSIINLYDNGFNDDYEFFLYLTSYLIDKINLSSDRRDVYKIPNIISNLYNYKGDENNRIAVKNRKNKVMANFYNKYPRIVYNG